MPLPSCDHCPLDKYTEISALGMQFGGVLSWWVQPPTLQKIKTSITLCPTTTRNDYVSMKDKIHLKNNNNSHQLSSYPCFESEMDTNSSPYFLACNSWFSFGKCLQKARFVLLLTKACLCHEIRVLLQ